MKALRSIKTRSKTRPARRAVLVALVLSIGALAVPVFSGEEEPPRKSVTLTGFITDEWCGKANANPRGAECARSCAKKGSDLAIFAAGKLYKLSDKKKALQHLGYEVVVTGSLGPEGIVQVASIKKAEPREKSE